MPDSIIECALTGKLDAEFLIKWLNNENLEDTPEDCILNCCHRNEFVAYFLSYIRNQIDSILQTNSNSIQILQHSTPEKLLSSRRKHRRSISDPTSDDRSKDSLSVKPDRHSSHESPKNDKKRGRKVKTKLFPEDRNQSISSDESRLSIGVDRLIISSTPMKNGFNGSEHSNLASPVTPTRLYNERCDTPRLSHRLSKSSEKSCLGDYLVNVKSTKKNRKSTKNDSDQKVELDISNSDMFPEIGAKKQSSKEKRRIKPTHVDPQKSGSSTFPTDCFQQPSPLALEDNAAFKLQKLQPKESASNFETERNILKQERHKLMEKFNILNTQTSPKTPIPPQIKITQKDSLEKSQNYTKVDPKRVVMKEKLDFLADIYDTIFKNNLILSVNTEIYYLISLLLSKQCEEDCEAAENKLIENDYDYLLKSINNSTYFAVKSLWNLRSILEIVLDKNSLKTLGENKKVRSFYPDLAKFLLNCYGLRCESEANQEKPRTPHDPQGSNGVVCFNYETDNAENFPSVLSFQNFKKQRDMFYEIVRWYQASRPGGGGGGGVGSASLRSRVKALVGCACAAANHHHLAALLTTHMLAQATDSAQESKLSKLQRRLTCPTAPESHRLPHFNDKEMFYKELILNAENESFRAHLRDAISTEIGTLDSAHLALDDRANTNPDIRKEFLSLSKKLLLLGKFLGYLTALPYSLASDHGTKANTHAREPRDHNFNAPKEKVLENDLAVRSYSQPNLDLKGHLRRAQELGRLSITLPWVVQYLSLLDFTSLRLPYYRQLITTLLDIHIHTLTPAHTHMHRHTVVYLKSVLGWLLDLPHFPQELLYENIVPESSVISESGVDSCDVVDQCALFELCPYLRDVNVLLSTCRVSQAKVCSYRHITPVSLSRNLEDSTRSKEKELQRRLEEELLRRQPAWTRRVVEVVVERVSAAAAKDLAATVLPRARTHARDSARHALRAGRGVDAARACYADAVSSAVQTARSAAAPALASRARAALAALVCGAQAPLHALAARAAARRLDAWLADNWNSTAILCNDMDAELHALLATSDVEPQPPRPLDVAAITAPQEHFRDNNVSPAACIIQLKEAVCSVLEGGAAPALDALVSRCAASCSPTNVFWRPPTQRALLQLSIDLALVYVSRRPTEVTEQFLQSLHSLWNICCPDRKPPTPQEISLPERREDLSPEFRNLEDDERPLTPPSDEEAKPIVSEPVVVCPEVPKVPEVEETDLQLFERVLCPRNIVMLSASQCSPSEVWAAMASLLVFLLNHYYLSEDSLTEQCLAVYRQDWPQNILENLSTCMKTVSSRWSRSSTGKFTLFLDFLAEYCGDMDFEPMD